MQTSEVYVSLTYDFIGNTEELIRNIRKTVLFVFIV